MTYISNLPAAARGFIALSLGSLACGIPAPILAQQSSQATAENPSRVTNAPAVERTQFLGRSSLGDIKLSSDGRNLAYLARGARGQSLLVMPTDGGAPRLIQENSDARRLFWSNDGTRLFVESRSQIVVIDLAHADQQLTLTPLGGPAGRSVFAADPQAPAAILLMELAENSDGVRIYRLLRMSADGHSTILHEDQREILDAAFDIEATTTYLKFADRDHHSVERLEGGVLHPTIRCVRLENCVLLSVTGRGHLLMQSDTGGDLQRLVSVAPDGRTRTIQADPRGRADLAEVTLDPVSHEPLVLSFRSTGARNIGLTAAARLAIAAIERSLGHSNFDVTPANGPGARWLLIDRDDRLQFPRILLFDPARSSTTEILGELGAMRIAETSLGRKIPVSFRASDGVRVYGFLTLPPGRAPGSVPLVVNVHGGPWANIGPGFNPITQLLASRGYAVYEPNFRGSTGYGRRYMFAPSGDFGNGRVQQDIVEGTRNVLARGIGDRARVAIIGVSFGGYSALLGATFEPELFKAALAVAPPTDFALLTRFGEGVPNPVSEGISLSTRLQFHSLSGQGIVDRLHAQSPAANAALLRRPVYILAGGRDQNVPLASIVAYAEHLRALGKDVNLVVDPDAGHGPTTPMSQQAFMYLLEHTLHVSLGGPAPAIPGAELATFLRTHSLARGNSPPSNAE